MAKPTVEEALTLAEKRKNNWCLIGYDQHGRPRYACGTCFMFHFTRTGKRDPEIPANCPRCGTRLDFMP